jgi:hypothetical protein
MATRRFARAVKLEQTSETSANGSLGDLDGDGDLDIVLAKGRHWPLHDRVLLNNGKGELRWRETSDLQRIEHFVLQWEVRS